MHVVATFDQPMINQWTAQQEAIQKRLSSMQRDLTVPYRHAPLPQVQRPEYILVERSEQDNFFLFDSIER